MTYPRWRDALDHVAIAFLFLAAFPRLAHRMRWPTRLGPRGLLAYVAFNTAIGVALRTWVVPFFKRIAQEQERAKEQMRRQLGREPTDDELIAHLRITCRR